MAYSYNIAKGLTIDRGSADEGVSFISRDDSDLKFKSEGTGTIRVGDAGLKMPDADGALGQVLQTDGSGNLTFEDRSPFSALSDTAITSPLDGHFSIYDEGASKWKNHIISGDVEIDKDGVATIQLSASAADGLNYTAGDFTLDQSIKTDATPTFSGLTITGNLTTNGTTTTVNATQVDVQDPVMRLASNNPADSRDIGLVGLYNDGANKHTALFRDASDGKWKLITGSTQTAIPTANEIDVSVASVGVLVASLEGDVTGTVSDITNHGIDKLSDVDTTTYTPSDRQTLVWSNSNAVWEPGPVNNWTESPAIGDASLDGSIALKERLYAPGTTTDYAKIYAKKDFKEGTVLLLHFDVDSISDPVDASENDLSCSYNGSPSLESSSPSHFSGDSSIHLDGNLNPGEYVHVIYPNTLALDGEFTIDFWFKLDDITEDGQFFLSPLSQDTPVLSIEHRRIPSGSWIRVAANSLDDLSTLETVVQSIQSIGDVITADDTWYHCAVTRDSNNNWRLYLNGHESDDVGWGVTADIEYREQSINWGSSNGNGQFLIKGGDKGNIDEFRITRGERIWTEDFSSTFSSSPPGPYTAENLVAIHVQDSSGNSLALSDLPTAGHNHSGVHAEVVHTHTMQLSDLSDVSVDTQSPAFGDALVWNIITEEWEPGTIVGFEPDAAMVFNESGAAVDFRVEGDTDPNLLLIDGSADKVGIGVANPDQKLEVAGAIHLSGEIATPSPPANNDGGVFYTKEDGKPYWTSYTQSEINLSDPYSTNAFAFTGLEQTPGSLGSSEQQLRMNNAGTALEFFDAAVSLTVRESTGLPPESYSGISILEFDDDAGFEISDEGAGKAKITISASGHTHGIDNLSDVDTSTTAPTDGQALIWDNANSKWEPGTTLTCQDDEPGSPNVGDMWYETDRNIFYTRIEDSAGTQVWLDLSTSGGDSGGVLICQNDSPNDPNIGDMWYETDRNIFYTRIEDSAGTQVWLDLSTAGSDEGGWTNSGTNTVEITVPGDSVGIGVAPVEILTVDGVLALKKQTSDPSGTADYAKMYSKDVSGSTHMWVADEAGNDTQISPHNSAGEWEYYSENKITGKRVRINMERMIRKLEEITGETFIEYE